MERRRKSSIRNTLTRKGYSGSQSSITGVCVGKGCVSSSSSNPLFENASPKNISSRLGKGSDNQVVRTTNSSSLNSTNRNADSDNANGNAGDDSENNVNRINTNVDERHWNQHETQQRTSNAVRNTQQQRIRTTEQVYQHNAAELSELTEMPELTEKGTIASDTELPFRIVSVGEAEEEDVPPPPPPRPPNLFSTESSESMSSNRSQGRSTTGLGRRLRSMLPRLRSFEDGARLRQLHEESLGETEPQLPRRMHSAGGYTIPEPLGADGQQRRGFRASVGQRARRIFRNIGSFTNQLPELDDEEEGNDDEEEERPPPRPARPVVPGSAIVFDGEALPPRFEETHGLVHISYLPHRPNIVDAVIHEPEEEEEHPVADVAHQSTRSLIPPLATEASESVLMIHGEAEDALELNHDPSLS